MGYLRKAKLKDLNHVIQNMRVMDKIEVFYQTNLKPEEAIQFSYLATKDKMAIAADNDNPIGLCGVSPDGCIWMVATDELFQNKKYKLLYNMVYAENDSAIKWLRSLGFTFINYHAEYGEHSKPFYEFMRIA